MKQNRYIQTSILIASTLIVFSGQACPPNTGGMLPNQNSDIPGPAGEAGPAGPAGPPGNDGQDGASPFSLQGNDAVYTQGNVGLGTVSPSEQLEVVGNTKVNGTVFADAFSSNSPLHLQTNGVTRIFVNDATGNVGVGTSSPGNRLTVNGAADITGRVSIGVDIEVNVPTRLLVRGTATEDAFRVRVEDNSKLVVKSNGGISIGANYDVTAVPANGMRIQGAVGIGGADPGAFILVSSGDAAKPGGGSWSVFSDARLKRDIESVPPGMLDRILSLRGCTFEYVEDAIENRLGLPGKQMGMIAQEVQKVFPNWVAEDHEGYLYVTERGTTAIFVEAMRELRTEKDAAITALKSDNDDLRQRMQRMEAALAQLSERQSSGD